MNRRIRRRSTTADGYLRYLKPGALAQLRDSKINARTHHRSIDSQIYISRANFSSSSLSPASVSSPSRSPIAAVASQLQHGAAIITAIDGGSPCFSVRLYGPRRLQQKKLMAARSMFFLNPNPSSPTSDGPEPVIDAFTNGFLVAH
ncbi:uncharacterized protein [Rutidosis leptorrhynchoides]|uniref:uncharacterized protein n=1 Tax=Rutidosis leptorrhynchoides TaxID=125765 RepID=UPI003A99F16A